MQMQHTSYDAYSLAYLESPITVKNIIIFEPASILWKSLAVRYVRRACAHSECLALIFNVEQINHSTCRYFYN